MTTAQATARQQWQNERARLEAMLADGRDNTGWPLSPEAKDNLRRDIAECNRTLVRLAAQDDPRGERDR